MVDVSYACKQRAGRGLEQQNKKSTHLAVWRAAFEPVVKRWTPAEIL